ncbi:hypothetical protein TIFTF001_004157 [Ficus carica]|uniref:Uncharacterized protein n=1 Tax=Ficus carica TaxID=3494 RepID=A0AA87ZBY6_FICCA|nr:hypothetical protein TIFTF001_004157 [Ficus carica]
MNYHENPNPNWSHHHFPASTDPPPMDFELSDYLVFDDGATGVDRDSSSPSQSMASAEKFVKKQKWGEKKSICGTQSCIQNTNGAGYYG